MHSDDRRRDLKRRFTKDQLIDRVLDLEQRDAKLVKANTALGIRLARMEERLREK